MVMELDQDPEAPTPARRSGSLPDGVGAMAPAQASAGPPRGQKKGAGRVGSSLDSSTSSLGDSQQTRLSLALLGLFPAC